MTSSCKCQLSENLALFDVTFNCDSDVFRAKIQGTEKFNASFFVEKIDKYLRRQPGISINLNGANYTVSLWKETNEESTEDVPVAAIVGACLASLIVLGVICFLVFLHRRNGRDRSSSESQVTTVAKRWKEPDKAEKRRLSTVTIVFRS